MQQGSGEVTVFLQQMRACDSQAADKLIPLVVDELRRLARFQLRDERPGHTLQPTALVNEAYLRLVSDHARRKKALKRGSGVQGLGEVEDYVGLSLQQAAELMALNIALDRLEQMSSRQRQVVELRYFGGLSTEEAVEVLHVSLITIKRDWVAARAWLKIQLRPDNPASNFA